LYWALAGLPFRMGYSWRMKTWAFTEDGLEVRDTPVFEVVGREEVPAADGHTYLCWVVSLWSEAQQARFLNYVTDRPPFLIKQEGEEPLPVITLRRVSSEAAGREKP
jgi:hypothetical protein